MALSQAQCDATRFADTSTYSVNNDFVKSRDWVILAVDPDDDCVTVASARSTFDRKLSKEIGFGRELCPHRVAYMTFIGSGVIKTLSDVVGVDGVKVGPIGRADVATFVQSVMNGEGKVHVDGPRKGWGASNNLLIAVS